ncbi:MAG TPA: hypothetical protein VHB50_18515 [Bryobacteraceae bacterium]|nr:hypothetical protein [Bryobacteraceae bacterium]
MRIAQAADVIGIRRIVALGFDPSPRDPMTQMATMSDVRALVF